MKHLTILICALFCALACGGMGPAEPIVDYVPTEAVEINGELFYPAEPIVDYVDDFDYSREAWFEAPEIAQPGLMEAIEKATYTIPNGYGIAGDGLGCQSSGFAGGECKVPKSKAACAWQAASTETPPAGMLGAGQAALVPWETFAEANGWSVAFSNVTCPSSTRQIRIRFEHLGDGILGKATPMVNSGDVFTIAAGTVKPWTHTYIGIDPSTITGFPGYSSKNQTQKNNFAFNTYLHELGHALGLSHNGLIDTLMSASPVEPPATSSKFLSQLGFLSSEYKLVKNYSVSN